MTKRPSRSRLELNADSSALPGNHRCLHARCRGYRILKLVVTVSESVGPAGLQGENISGVATTLVQNVKENTEVQSVATRTV